MPFAFETDPIQPREEIYQIWARCSAACEIFLFLINCAFLLFADCCSRRNPTSDATLGGESQVRTPYDQFGILREPPYGASLDASPGERLMTLDGTIARLVGSNRIESNRFEMRQIWNRLIIWAYLADLLQPVHLKRTAWSLREAALV